MTENSNRPRARRTFSAFGDVRRMPSEYEIVTHGTELDDSRRTGRRLRAEPVLAGQPVVPHLPRPVAAAGRELGRVPRPRPADLPHLRQRTGRRRDQDPGRARGSTPLPVPTQAFAPGWVRAARHALHARPATRARLPAGRGLHRLHRSDVLHHQRRRRSSTADFLRRVTTIAYRTRELQLAHPEVRHRDRGSAALGGARRLAAGARKAVESALITYDWGEAFTALNLVLLPTLDDVLTRQFGEVARANGDNLSWLHPELPRRRQPATQPLEPGGGTVRHQPEAGVAGCNREMDRQVVAARR